jgi:hypothetical protein
LGRGGQPGGAAFVELAAFRLIEQQQKVVGVRAEPDHVGDRQPGAGGGVRDAGLLV